jgi:hypothetical protein
MRKRRKYSAGHQNASSLLEIKDEYLLDYLSEIHFILVEMASSIAPIAETWPENVLPPIGSRKSLSRKIRLVYFMLGSGHHSAE